jgi:hypothetical protein
MATSKPMAAEVVPDVSPTRGFVWRHGAYSTPGVGGNASREFTPPASNISRYEVDLPGGGKLPVQVQTFVVPVRPGVCRTFFKVRRGRGRPRRGGDEACRQACPAPSKR